MKSYAVLNKEKIDKFDIDYYLKKKNYQMASALKALDVTNDIQISFFKHEDNLTNEDYVLRLYALLQGLFVSIDSLYAVAYALTNSKSFININNNAVLRKLKYIRNDVVGHPANRVLSDEALAYCILDEKSITKDEFSYKIYTAESIINKTVDIKELLIAYYTEANNLLNELYKLAIDNKNNTKLEELIFNTLNAYYNNKDYKAILDDFILEYNKIYPDSKKSQHRILWRYELIDRLYSIDNEDDELDLAIEYCIGLEIIKIYELIFNKKYKSTNIKKSPSYISSIYRMIKKNKDLEKYIEYLKDADHPLFYKCLSALLHKAKSKKILDATKYLEYIIASYNLKDFDMVYALVLPIRNYKIK